MAVSFYHAAAEAYRRASVLQRDGQSRGAVRHQLPGHAHDAQDWSLPRVRPVQLQHWAGHEAAESFQ